MVVGEAAPVGWTLPGYEHVQRLGSGAGGQVWLARHLGTGTLVAVKYLVPGLHEAADFREAYRSEAQLLAGLDTPHVSQLYEYVEGPPGAAIVMEAVEGSSLRALMQQEGATTPEAALCVLKGSLLGLAAAHAIGVVHRDYKPANVLVTPDGASKLVDFGIAARSGEAVQAAGTPLYMAPEQFSGEPASPAGDVYSATVTFFQCVTGKRPYPGSNALELMAQHTLGAIPDEEAPEAVRGLIRHGMAKDPADRPATALEFLDELEQTAVGAYGEDWEERGQRKIATLLALLPLLLLRTTQPAAPAATTSVATTVLGAGGMAAGAGAAAVGAGLLAGAGAKGRRHLARSTVATSVAGALVVAGVGVAAAYQLTNKPAKSTQQPAASTSAEGATTLVTPSDSASASPSALPSPSPSASASASATATPTSGTGAGGQPTSSGSAKASASASAKASPSASPSPSTGPLITILSLTSLTCDYTEVSATISVTTNGVAGSTLTYSWYYIDDAGAKQTIPGSTTTEALRPGTVSSQNFTASESFEQYAGEFEWGIDVSTSPGAKLTLGTSVADPIRSSGCDVIG